ncbi:MAG: hypothetical protein JNM72_21755 [Deltaproteobacteria bacterium]|nr:hypothetical protein [Deltaproteobacteria bacterium]
MSLLALVFSLSPLVFSPSAQAFAPAEGVHTGSDPRLVIRIDPVQQARLRHQPSWLAFLDGPGEGWVARFSPFTGLPLRAFGPPIPLQPARDGAGVAAAVQAALADSPGVVGVPWAQLRLGRADWIEAEQAWILRFDQVVPGQADPPTGALRPQVADFGPALSHGQPAVWGGALHVIVRNNAIVSLQAATFPGAAALPLAPALDRAAARAIAQRQGPDQRPSTAQGEVLGLLPVEDDGAVALRPVWLVRTTVSGSMPARYLSFVDAETGALHAVTNEVRYLTGTLSGAAPPRMPSEAAVSHPLPFLTVRGSGGGSDTTDEDGAFSVSGDASARLRDGQYFSVDNQDGDDASLSWSSADVLWGTSNATQAELSSYIYLNEVRALWGALADDSGYTVDRMSSNVNLNDVCNAYYDGNVNFYLAGSGCNNTGELLDVNYHEWGHGLHAYAAGTWRVDGSVGEGAADTVAFISTKDSVMARGFMTDGSGIREVSRDRVYPDDLNGSVHDEGLIFGGGGWDLMTLLQERDGEDAAEDTMRALLWGALTTNPALADGYDAYVFADDDNGDLSDGTPNQCLIVDAFAAHGLGPGGGDGGLLALRHVGLENQSPAAASYPVSALIESLAPTCASAEVSAAEVVFSTDRGETWQRAPLTLSGGSLEGAIPAQPAGSVVEYYIEAAPAEGGEPTQAPLGGVRNPLSFVVGELTPIWCSDFEADDAGFTSALISGEDIDGANDWHWDRPKGTGDDPDGAFSGRYAWGNDLAPEDNWDGLYQDNRHNRLSSPPIPTAGHDRVVVQFRRWLNVEDGVYDQANVLANEELVWSNHSSTAADGEQHHLDTQWALHSLLVEAPGAELTLGWEIVSDGGLTFGGWTIDDVCVYALAPPSVVDDTGAVTDEEDPADPGPDTDAEGDSDAVGAFDDEGKATACGCASQPGAPVGGGLVALGAGALALLRRRRRS